MTKVSQVIGCSPCTCYMKFLVLTFNVMQTVKNHTVVRYDLSFIQGIYLSNEHMELYM